jgi:hypothetical protein
MRDLPEFLFVGSKNLEKQEDPEETKGDEKDSEGPPQVKVAQVDLTPEAVFPQEQEGDEEAADQENDLHTEGPVEDPFGRLAEGFRKPGNRLAVKTKNEKDAHGSPPVKRGQISGDPGFGGSRLPSSGDAHQG